MSRHRKDEQFAALEFAQTVSILNPVEGSFVRTGMRFAETKIRWDKANEFKGTLSALHREAVKLADVADQHVQLSGKVPEREREPLRKTIKASMNTICDLTDQLGAMYDNPGVAGKQVRRSLRAEIGG